MLATKIELIHSNNHTILNELHNLSQLGIFLPTLIFARYAQPNPSYVVDELNNPECTHPSLALRFLGGIPSLAFFEMQHTLQGRFLLFRQ